jgi:outer membrane protein insertion porin family
VARAAITRWALPVLAVLTVSTVPVSAWGQALQTWGGQDGTHEIGVGTIQVNVPPAPPNVPAPVPAPVPDAVTPPGSVAVPPPGLEDPENNESIVRAGGHVGLRYVLEGVEVRGNTKTLTRVVLRYVPFKVGAPLDADDVELTLTRFRLLGTGFFRDVQLSLRRGSRRGNAILVVTVRERNTVVVNDFWLGLATDANSSGNVRPLTAYGGLDVADTNLAGTGVTVGGAVAVAEDQIALRTRFVDPQFLHSNWTVQAELLFNDARDFFGNGNVLVLQPGQVPTDYAVVAYQRFGGSFGVGHDLGISSRFNLDYRLEYISASLPLAGSDQRGTWTEPINYLLNPGNSYLSALRASFVYDTRDEPFLPTRGDRVTVLGDLSLTPLGSDYPYFKIQAHASHWFELPWHHVLELDAFAGAIFGNAPLFENYYVGDFSDLLPDRVLGLNFDRRAAPNFLKTDIGEVRYGQYAAELNVSYRMPLYHGHRSIYGIDAFASGGIYGVATQQDFTNSPPGYTGFPQVPIDLTFNLGVQIETSVGGFTFGLSNFLGFIPSYGGGR